MDLKQVITNLYLSARGLTESGWKPRQVVLVKGYQILYAAEGDNLALIATTPDGHKWLISLREDEILIFSPWITAKEWVKPHSHHKEWLTFDDLSNDFIPF